MCLLLLLYVIFTQRISFTVPFGYSCMSPKVLFYSCLQYRKPGLIANEM
jgi:hypothetical protein